MKWIPEAGLHSHLLHECPGLLQALGGMMHLEPEEVLIRTLAVIAPEQAAQVGVVDMTFAGNLAQRPQPQAAALNVTAT